MHKFLAMVIGVLTFSTVLAASPAVTVSASPSGVSLLMQRILLRRAVRSGYRLQPVPAVNVLRSQPVINVLKPPTRSSSSVYVYTGTPIRGVMQIDQVSTGTAQNAAGTQGVTLITFDVTVSNEDVALTTLKFRAEQGSLSAASQYTLYAVAPSGTLTPLAVASIGGSTLTFGNLQVVLRNSYTQRFAVKAQLNSTSASSVLALGFLTSDPLFVQATGLHYGRDLAPGIEVDNVPCTGPYVCRIIVHTRASRAITVESMGNLFVTADSTPASSHQMLLGTRSDAILRLTFHATDEDVAVTSLSIDGGSDSMSAIELFTDESSLPFATARQLQCETVASGRFCASLGNGLFSVPKDGQVRVFARALLKAKNEGGVSGQTAAPFLSDATSSAVAVTARGLSSDHLLVQNDGDSTADGEVVIGRSTPGLNSVIAGPTHDAVAAKILQIVSASPDPDLSPVPLGVSPFAVFRFTALPNDNNKSILLTKLVFTVTANNVVLGSSGIALYNTANNSSTASCTSSGTTGTITVTCASLENSGISTVIAQGGSLTLALRGNISMGTNGGTSFLQAALGQLGDRANTGTVEWTDGISSFNWADLPVTQVKSTLYRS